jgi:hypothetical protein
MSKKKVKWAYSRTLTDADFKVAKKRKKRPAKKSRAKKRSA